jgi:predicted nucleic acid-binding protein
VIQILDASTLLNLANGEVLSKVLRLPGTSFQVSGVVRDESRTVAQAIDVAVAAGHLALVDDKLISISRFLRAKAEWQLDDGETECILAAAEVGSSVACDDKAARKVILKVLGRDRLTGSIGLLREAVKAGLLTQAGAFAAYRLMRERGGFLPAIDEVEF